MRHAIEILELERLKLRSLLRDIERNMHIVMSSIDPGELPSQLADIESAILALRGGDQP